MGFCFSFLLALRKRKKKHIWVILGDRVIRVRVGMSVGLRALTAGCTLLKYYGTHTQNLA